MSTVSKKVFHAGEWWIEPWWLEDKYYSDSYQYSKKQAETAFKELINIFDATWMHEQIDKSRRPPFRHDFAPYLINKGIMYFQLLCSLGLRLHQVRKAFLLGDLERRLKNPNEYWESAAFELTWLSYLLEQGYEINRHYPSGVGRCNCDFKISRKSKEYFIEIKRPMSYSQVNERRNTQSLRDIAKQIEEDTLGNIQLIPISSSSELEKVFRLARDAVKKQLPANGLGYVFIESPHHLDWEEFEKVATRRFRKKIEYYANLHAIILIEITFNGNRGKFECEHKTIYNPKHVKHELPFPLPNEL
ncbi:MAG: hypothetical protein KAR83_07720 [Thermodesulfovibrionales bacterium]|nr:hypothetical protein [Thermodesulfovibrionales bacterium]